MEVNINLNIPKSWNELTDKQMKNIGKIFHKKGEVFDLTCWLILNDVKAYQFRRLQQLKTVMQLVTMTELKKHFSFIYEKNDRHKFIEFKGYQKPQDRIFNLTIEEYAVADDLNNKYLETGDLNFLRHLVAVLYKKPNEKYNIIKQNQRAKRFRFLKGYELLAVHITWNGCKEYITKRFPKVYPKVKAVQGKGKNQKGFLDVVLQLSGGKFGTYQETKNELVYTFLAEFENTIINQEIWKEKSRTKG